MRRTVALLGASQALEYAAQLLLPVLLVRLLTPDEFGGYRVAWLLAQTTVAALTMNLAQNLVYQAARQPGKRYAALFGNASAYFALVGLAAAVLVGPGGLGARMLGAEVDVGTTSLIAAFVFLWTASLPVETIGLMMGRPVAQAKLALVSTLMRVVVVGSAAVATCSLEGVVAALVAVAGMRGVLLAIYAIHSARLRPRVDLPLIRWQLLHAFGFGMGASFFALRTQADGWIAALLIDQRAVAIMAVAASVVPVVGIARAAVTNAALPVLSRAIAQGRLSEALALNRRINLHLAGLLAPVVGGLIALAPELLTIVFTAAFEPAATPLRLYVIGYVAALIETTTLIQSLGYGRFVLLQGALLFVLSATLGLIGALTAGTGGIAIGAALSAICGAVMNLAFLARRHGIAWRDLQDWPMLGRIAITCATAGGTTLLTLSTMPADGGPWIRLAIGGICFAVAWTMATMLSPSLRSLYRHMLRRPAMATP